MKSLRSVLSQHQLATILYLQEFALFVIMFIPMLAMFRSFASHNYFDYKFSVEFITGFLSNNSSMIAFVIMAVFAIVLFILLRIYLMGGIFEALNGSYQGFSDLLTKSTRHFFRFVFLFLLYSIPLLITASIAGRITTKIAEASPNQMMPIIMMTVSRIIAILLSVLFSYWHTSARFRTITDNRFRLAFRISIRKFFPFLAYQVISVIIVVFFGGLSIYLLTKHGALPLLLAFFIMQIGLYGRNLFKLASYEVLV